MPIRKTCLALLAALTIAGPATAQEVTVVQPFEGSETMREYAVEFDRLTYIAAIGEEEAETATIEGTLSANLYRWPEDKAALEILRSFERALEAAGFSILVSVDTPRNSLAQSTAVEVIGANNLRGRGYGTDAQWVGSAPGQYLSASRTEGGQHIVVALTLSSLRPVYMLEVAAAAAMEEGTVEITAEALTAEIEEAGKAILYGVQFDTGSAVIRPSSTGSLETIAEVLQSREGRFYVVGHTDDTGGFEMNMRLSADRAASIVRALVEQYGIDASRLQSGGVGPLAPLASNENDAGRQLNRRVELVERLDE